MSFPNCGQAGHMHIRFEKPDKVILSRCCMRDFEILDVLNIQEYLKIDPYEWCISNFGKNPTPHNFKCEYFTEECDYTKDYDLKYIEVAISQACNLKCPMCFLGSTHIDTKEMKDAYFKTLYSLKGRNLFGLRLTDRGEPFFYKKELLEFLKSCNSNEDFLQVQCTSNAQLLDEEFIKELSQLPFTFQVCASLDSLNESVYSQIRKNGNLNKALSNIKLLNNYGLLIYIHAVLQPLNKDEFLKIKDFAEKELGVNFSFGVIENYSCPEIERQLY